jgi:hypothetical protein
VAVPRLMAKHGANYAKRLADSDRSSGKFRPGDASHAIRNH